MNFHFPNPLDLFRPKPAHTEVRYVVPTKHELTEAQRRLQARQASVRCQLAVYAATTSQEQRKADAETFFATQRLMRVVGRVG